MILMLRVGDSCTLPERKKGGGRYSRMQIALEGRKVGEREGQRHKEGRAGLEN